MNTTPWFKYLLTHHPGPVLKKVKYLVLGLNGDKDVQIPCEQNLAGKKNALEAGGNINVRIRTIGGLNHSFKDCESGIPEEYNKITQAISPKALAELKDWILIQIK